MRNVCRSPLAAVLREVLGWDALPAQQPAPSSNTLADGLMHFYPLTEASGERINTEHDLPLVERITGGAYPWSIPGTIATMQGLRGPGTLAAKFVGGEFPDYSDFLFAESTLFLLGQPMTISYWLYIGVLDDDPYASGEVLSVGTAASEGAVKAAETNLYGDYETQGVIDVTVANGSVDFYDEGTFDYEDLVGQWHHVVLGYDVNEGFFQFNNGARVTRAPDEPPIVLPHESGVLLLGSGNQPPIEFAVQFLAMWDRVLTVEDVTQLYNAGLGLTRDEMFGTPASINGLSVGLTQFWPLNEATGDRINTERTLVLSENGGAIGTTPGVRAGTVAAHLEPGKHFESIADATLLTGQPFTQQFWFKLLRTYGAYDGDYITNYENTGIYVSAGTWHGGPGDSYFAVTNWGGEGTAEGGALSYPSDYTMDFDAWVGVWHHVIWGSDGTNIFFQLDAGARAVEPGTPFLINDPGARVVINGGAGIAFADAGIEKFAHWDRVLTEAEVEMLYNAGQGLTRAEMT